MRATVATISIHSLVSSVGAYVGLASLVAVAILTLLYFAHARETETLRERLDDAQQHIGGLEARLAQLMHAQAAGARIRPPGAAPSPVPAPVPAPIRPGSGPIPSVRRVPTPVTAAAGGPPPARPAPAPTSAQSPLLPAASAGVAGPSLGSATKLIPDPARPAVQPPRPSQPDDTLFVPAAPAAATIAAAAAGTAAAGNGHGPRDETAVLTAAPQRESAAASARIPSASPPGAAPSRPVVRIGQDAGAGSDSRRGGRGGSHSSIGPLLDDSDASGRRSTGRVLPLLIGLIAAAVIVAGVIVIGTHSGNGTPAKSHQNTSTQTGASLKNHHKLPPPFVASRVLVAVLNGTAQAGLAGDVGTKLARLGYRKGTITNAANQTEALTYVYYMPGAHRAANRIGAKHVATALGLKQSRVRPANSGAIQSCKISATGTQLPSCRADVIVSVGLDRVDLATGGTAG